MKTTCNTPVIAVTPKGRFIFPYFMSVSSVSFVRSKIIIGFSFLQSPHVSIILLNYIIVASNVQNRFVIKRKADGNGFETYCWFSHDVTNIQTTKLFILLIFYFHDIQEQLKANIHAKFCSKWVLGFVINYA